MKILTFEDLKPAKGIAYGKVIFGAWRGAANFPSAFR